MMVEQYYMGCAMKEAKKAYDEQTYPIGAVIVDPGGNVIGCGHNLVYSHGDFTAHAEIEAIRNAGNKLMWKPNFGMCTLYTTMEPCLMCCGAILVARIKRVVWVLDDERCGALQCLRQHISCLGSDYEGKMLPLVSERLNDRHLKQCMSEWMRDWETKKEEWIQSRWRMHQDILYPESAIIGSSQL